MRAKLSIILFLFLCAGSGFFPLTLAKLQWVKEGLYVVYRLELGGGLVVTRVTTTSNGGDVGVDGAIGFNGTYSWNVKSLNGSYGDVDTNLDLFVREYIWVPEESKYNIVDKEWNKTAQIKLNVDDREAITTNGTSLGKINYWIDPTVQKGDNVTIYGKPPYEINVTVQNYLYNPVRTPAGEFDCWEIYIHGKRPDIEGVALPACLILWYDKATGILVAAQSTYFDVVTMMMGILEINLDAEDTFQAPSSFVLESLTTQPSPSTEFLKLSDYLPYITAAIIIAAIPTAVYITRRSKKKAS